MTRRPAYLATVDQAGAPRVHPVTPVISAGRLFLFMEPTSPKGRDLDRGSRYALHNGVPDDEGTGGEVLVAGTGRRVDDPERRREAARSAPYEPADRYVLYELSVERVVVTDYVDGWARRGRWRAT